MNSLVTFFLSAADKKNNEKNVYINKCSKKKKKEKNRKDASPFLKDTRKGGMDACWEGWMGAFEEYVERSG